MRISCPVYKKHFRSIPEVIQAAKSLVLLGSGTATYRSILTSGIIFDQTEYNKKTFKCVEGIFYDIGDFRVDYSKDGITGNNIGEKYVEWKDSYNKKFINFEHAILGLLSQKAAAKMLYKISATRLRTFIKNILAISLKKDIIDKEIHSILIGKTTKVRLDCNFDYKSCEEYLSNRTKLCINLITQKISQLAKIEIKENIFGK